MLGEGTLAPPRADTGSARSSTPASFYLLLGTVFAVFVVSTVPGVRPHGGYNLVLDGVLNNVAYELAAMLCLLRAAQSTSFRRSWWFLGIGLALYGLGNIYWTAFIRPLDPEPFPSLADALWLSFYPFAFVALVLVVREMTDELPLSLWLDGVVGGLAVAAVAAAFFGSILQVTGGSSAAAVITTLAYPLLDLLLLIMTTAVLALFHWRPPTGLWFLAGGLILFAVVDATYLFAAAKGTYQPGGVMDSTWVLATLAIGFAPAWPNRPMGVVLPSWLLLGIPVTATTVALCLLVYDHDHMLNPVAIALAAAAVVFALGRLVVTFREATVLAHSHELALTDELTHLGNRRAFYERLQQALAAGAGGERGGLLLLDLDRFKEVNDSLGHHAGDDLLCQVARRFSDALHGTDDFLVRLGGDEFAVLLLGADALAAERVAGRIHDTLAAPFAVDGVTVRVGASIGISLFPEHGTEASTLLRHADIAMYEAKGLRSGFAFYSSARDSLQGQERLRTEEELRDAIRTRSLAVHFQPKVHAGTRAVSGVEALVRWDHPRRGLLFPDAFLPLAEATGLMRDLTAAVLEQSLDQVRRWREGGRHLTVAVNLSASSLVDAELPQLVWSALRERDLPPDALELEITEDFLMGDRERARAVLGDLRRVGIRVAVDDFGTGYSSLAYLRELPIDELKLDRSFVQPMAEDPRAAAIVRSTIDLAHSLGMTLVAEGVEDEATADHLARSGCDEAQGFFFSRALPAPDLERWMDAHASVAPAGEPAPRPGVRR